jgi:hypothetical protein
MINVALGGGRHMDRFPNIYPTIVEALDLKLCRESGVD